MPEKNEYLKPPHLEVTEILSYEIPVSRVRVRSEHAARILGKPRGLYITMETGPLDKAPDLKNICACLTGQLRPLLSPFFGKALCVCGIGNPDLTYDSLGPEVAKRFFPHSYETLSLRSNFKKVAMICPGPPARTNLSTGAHIAGIAAALSAACILAIDACLCQRAANLCSNIQLSDCGLQTDGGGEPLCQPVLGVPVISIGLPSLMRAPVLTGEEAPDLFLTSVHIADAVKLAAFVIANSITQVIYPELDYEACKQYIDFFRCGIL